MNLPNLLTILRILLIPVFINLLIYGLYPFALGVFLFASFTDGLDGLIARAANQRTTLGTYLDPMADKLLLTAAFIALSVFKFVPVWVSVIVVSRDLILVLGALVLHLAQAQFTIAPTLLGKATTLIQVLYIIMVLSLVVLNKSMDLKEPLLFGMLLLTITSGLHYIYRGIRPLNSHLRL
jgi:cardiolipin synthase (CMP-forming)